ncbi:hypothetical protein [Bradyrhizobium sp. I1.7.5]|uniref:hypothetical protein n=1 Tax=Bradyrhizobium sp. I1.7.5 TaxID=3156363 RepID=UPI003390C53A
MDRGFDFTDEAFYLMWAQEPSRFKIAYGLFGYGLHPLFVLAGESVAGLRRLAALIAVTSGGAAALVSLAAAGNSVRSPLGLQIFAASALLPFMYYAFWIPTPSYNWFALVAGLFLLCGMVDLVRPGSMLRSAFFVALSAILILFSRPHNALAYGCIYLLAAVLFVARVRLASLMLFASAFTLVLLATFACLAPLAVILEQSRSYVAIFGSSHPVELGMFARLLAFAIGPGIVFCCSGILFVVVSMLNMCGRLRPWMLIVPVSLSCLLVNQVFSLTWSNFLYRIGPMMGVSAYTALAFCRFRTSSNQRLVGVLGLAGLLPVAATFGSSDRISEQTAFFCGIWGIIAIVASCEALPRSWCPVAIVPWIALTFIAVHIGVSDPYRLASPLKLQVHLTRVGNQSELKLDERTRDFIIRLARRAREYGYCEGDLVLDVGSSSPGVIFAIGGHAPVFPWIFAGYPFSTNFAQAVVSRMSPDELSRTWLVTSEAPGTLTPEQIQVAGIDLSAYQLAVKLAHPVSGYPVNLFAPPQRGTCR